MSEANTSEQAAQRRAKLAALREAGEAYPNDFKPADRAAELHAAYDALDEAALAGRALEVRVAGRMMSRRVMGKASFAHLHDGGGRIQLHLRRDEMPDGAYAGFKRFDLGDQVGVEGTLFKTRTGELTVAVSSIRLLAKCLTPLPEKWHGLADQEIRYRQRYLDLITSEDSRAVFRKRSAIIAFVRAFFLERDFLEVETPMMQTIPGGAVARPFRTHHNALDMDLYLRIAPELFLKRLVIGGFERVFEINRNFRNEGMSTQHNPEFTMLEFYQAYADYRDCMDLTESLLRGLAREVHGSMHLDYQELEIDFEAPFARLTVHDATLAHNPDVTPDDLADEARSRAVAGRLGIECAPGWGRGKVWIEIFERTVEDRLLQPTFITAYPTEVSPLSRANDGDPFVTDRFEMFVAGREIANGFSELNDPDDQAARFRAQVEQRDSGDDEAMYYDHDYVRALEYGLPPTGGEGIGIDRLVMLFTNQPSIRDVLLFPHMRPESHD